jgi:hypothetical protein
MDRKCPKGTLFCPRPLNGFLEISANDSERFWKQLPLRCLLMEVLLGTWFWRRLLPEVAGLFAPAHDDAIFGADAAGIIKARADGAERHAFGRCGLADFLALNNHSERQKMSHGNAVRLFNNDLQ